MSTNDDLMHNEDEIIAEPTPPSSSPPPLLAFGNILEIFPEFLLLILPYIADRIVWKSIVSSNKKYYTISKENKKTWPPPWPRNFKLQLRGCRFSLPGSYKYKLCNPGVWSPCGTQIACNTADYENHRHGIVIFDQRHGLLRFRRHDDDGNGNDDNSKNNNNNNNNELNWIVQYQTCYNIPDLKFSPDGSFLVSAGVTCSHNAFVIIWNYNARTGEDDDDGGYDYIKLQEWNIIEELGDNVEFQLIRIDVSPCSRYVVVLAEKYVLLKDVQNNGKTIKSLLLPENEVGMQIIFSTTTDGHRSIFIRTNNIYRNRETIKIWHPYDNGVDEDDPDTTVSLITILDQSRKRSFYEEYYEFALSRDNSMLAIYDGEQQVYDGEQKICKVMLYSIDNNKESTTLKQSFPARCTSIQFTPDDKYVSYNNQNGLPAFWDVTAGREITDKMNITYNNNNNGNNIHIVNFSPTGSGHRILVKDTSYTFFKDHHRFFIASYWESEDSEQIENNKNEDSIKQHNG